MMEDLAMHLLEIVMNSVMAEAESVSLLVSNSEKDDVIRMEVKDDGCGMSPAMVASATSPFMTGRKKKTGLGLAFMKQLTEVCNGTFSLHSEQGVGTDMVATVQRSCIDTPPLGQLGDTVMAAIQWNGKVKFTFEYHNDRSDYIFDTKEVRDVLEVEDLNEPDILLWIKETVNQGVKKAEEDAR